MHILILVTLLFLTACSSAAESRTPTADTSPIRYNGLNREALSPHHATFLMQFAGDFNWSYRLDIRSDGLSTEYLLHLDGLSRAQNPGDVRMVTAQGVNRMRGPGTEDECVQFPTNLVLGPVFYTPDDLVNPAQIVPFLTVRGKETLVGVTTTHYSLNQIGVANWDELKVDIWWDEISGAALRYDLVASGADPLYNGGNGTLTGRFVVNAFGPQPIEPVEGCEIDLPLPGALTGLMKLPGLVAFESPSSPDDMVAFYQAELPTAGWVALAEPLVGVDATVLSYGRGDETLEINIEQRGVGSSVELFLGTQ